MMTRTGPHARSIMLAVVLGQVAALVEHGQAHDRPGDVDVADLLDLHHPAGGHPRPRAQRVEPELGGVASRTSGCRPASPADVVLIIGICHRGLNGASGVSARAVRAWPATGAIRHPPAPDPVQETPRARQEPHPRGGRDPRRPRRRRRLRRRARPRPPGRRPSDHGARSRFTCSRARRRDLHRLRRRVRRVGHPQRRRPRPGRRTSPTSGSHLPGLRRRERARRRRHRRATPTPARACTASSTRSTTRSTSTRQFEVPDSPPDVRRLRAARPQGHASRFTVTAPGPLDRSCPTPPRPQPEPARRRHARDVALRARPRRSPPTSPRSSPARTTCVRDERHRRRGGAVPLGVFCRKSLTPLPRRRQHLRPAPSRASRSSRRSSTAPTRSRSTTSSSRRSTTWARWRTPAAVTITEIYVFRSKVTEALVERRALTDPARAGPHVVRQPRDDAAGGTTSGSTSPSPSGPPPPARPRPPQWTERLDDLRHPREGLGLPPGPALLDPPDRRRHPRPRGRRGQLRRHHLRQGRLGAQAARRLRRPRAVRRRRCAPTSRKHAWGNTTLADLLAELEATSGRDLRDLVQAVARDRRRQHPAPGARGRRPGPASPRPPIAQTCADGLPDAAPAPPRDRPATPCADGQLVRTDRLELDVDGERTEVPELVGREQPDLLLLNDDDLAYAKIRLDERSLATALAPPARLHRVAAALAGARRRVGHDPRRRDAAPATSSTLVLETLPGETDSTLLRTLLAQLQTAVHSYSAPEHRGRRCARRPATGSGSSPSPPSPAATPSCSWSAPPPALTAAGDDTTRAAGAARRHRGARRAHRRLRDALDPAHRARRGRRGRRGRDRRRARPRGHRHRARAGRPAPAPRARPPRPRSEAWAAAVEGGGLPNAVVEAVGAGLHPPRHLARPAAPVRRALPRHARHGRGAAARTPWSSRSSTASTRARSPTPRLRDRTQAWLDANPHAPAALRRLVVENRDPVVRALAAQERDARG